MGNALCHQKSSSDDAPDPQAVHKDGRSTKKQLEKPHKGSPARPSPSSASTPSNIHLNLNTTSTTVNTNSSNPPSNALVFSRTHNPTDSAFNLNPSSSTKKLLPPPHSQASLATDSHRQSSDNSSTSKNKDLYSLEKMKERNEVSDDYQWLEGRRYHNTPGASYLLPNDIDEVDRLQLQHFILRYAIQGNYKSQLDKSTVRAILDVGCGPGTWTMEMANEFPDATITGIDMSAVFPTTIIPGNCRFIQHNILNPLPFPDNTFDFVYQRLLVAGLTPENWVPVLKELERVTKPGGRIELVEADGLGGNNGPYSTKIWGWVDKALQTRGVRVLIGREVGFGNMLKQAGVVDVVEEVLRLPTGEHGGKIGSLLKENEQSFWSAITPIVIHGAGVDKEEYEEATQIAEGEIEEYKSYHIFYVVTGRKRDPNAPLLEATN